MPTAKKATKKAKKKKREPVGHGARIAAMLAKKFPKASISTLEGGARSDVKEVVPTGIDVIDNWVIGCGGLPAGRMGELFSDADIGKTSLGLHFLAQAQRMGGIGMLFESENTFDSRRAAFFGIDKRQLLVDQMAAIEDVIIQMRAGLEYIPDGVGPNVMLWDSLAATALRKQIEEAMASGVGGKARLMSAELPVISRLLVEKRCAMVIINQTREKIGVMFGSNVTTPGGQSLKFQSSWRLQLWRGKGFETKGVPTGHRITVKAEKNKHAKPHKKAVVRFDYDDGFINDWSTVQLGKELGFVDKKARASKDSVEQALEGLRAHPDWGTKPL